LPFPAFFDICNKPEEKMVWWAEAPMNPLVPANKAAASAWYNAFYRKCAAEGRVPHLNEATLGSSATMGGQGPTLYGVCCEKCK
jgi:hypothetical protein